MVVVFLNFLLDGAADKSGVQVGDQIIKVCFVFG